jgi:hypothetical protein
MTLDVSLIDKRVVRRNLERGRIDAAEYQRMLEALPDASAKLQRIDGAQAPATKEPERAPEPRYDAPLADFAAST